MNQILDHLTMNFTVLLFLYEFTTPTSCRAVQQKSVHIEWAYTRTGRTESASHYQNQCVYSWVSKIFKCCPIETSVSSCWLQENCTVTVFDGHCLGYFFWLTLPFSLFFDIEFISGHSSSNMKLHRAILSYPAIIPAWLHSSSGLLWWWSSTEGVQARKTYICWRLALLSANIAVSLDLNEVRKRCPNQLPTASPVSSVYTNPTDLCSPFAPECCFPYAVTFHGPNV